MEKLHALMNPEVFQGKGKKASYFEGWYFKVVDPTEEFAFAIIPGIAYDSSGTGHAFIQVLDGKKKLSTYHKFRVDEFAADAKIMFFKVADNEFSDEHLQVRLDQFEANLTFSGNVPWPKPRYSPGIMGPFTFLPFMECKHAIVSMDHHIHGTITYQGREINFDGGKGYIEKDWGSSFPSAYVWMQSNHFIRDNISFKCSVAKIPYMGTSFVGFIAGLWINGSLLQFTTYNRSQLKKCTITEHAVNLTLFNQHYELKVGVVRKDATELASPIKGLMNGKIEESMETSIILNLGHRKGYEEDRIFVGRNGCLEVAGNVAEIVIT